MEGQTMVRIAQFVLMALILGSPAVASELVAGRTPFIYFPLKNHFEQNFHVAHRLDRYRAGRRMEFATSTPDIIAGEMAAALSTSARFEPVDAGGAARAAGMLADLF
jgi:hypothetical protein